MPSMTHAGFIPPREPSPPDPGRGGGRRQRRKGRKKQAGSLAAIVIFLVAALAAGALIAIWMFVSPYQDTFAPGIYVMGHDLGGLKPAEAERLVLGLTEEPVASWKAELRWQDRLYILTASDIALSVDLPATLDELWLIGRESGLMSRFLALIHSASHPTDADPVIVWDEEPVEAMLSAIQADIERPAVEAEALYTPGEAQPFRYTDEQEGYRLNVKPLREAVLSAAEALIPYEAAIEPEVIRPRMTRSVLEDSTQLRARLRFDYGTDAEAHNAALGLSGLDGVQIGPGEEWRFNEAVGARTEDEGYQFAPESAYGPSSSGIGGGVCRASTSLYQLALMAGVTVKERHAAVYPTDYAPAGQEAAVSDRGLDLVLKNDSKTPLWLRVRLWEADGHTIAELQMIGEALSGHFALTSEVETLPAPTDPIYIRDREGRYATYTDQRIAVGEALPGFRSTVLRIALNDEGEEQSREVISEDVYEAIPARVYIGVKDR